MSHPFIDYLRNEHNVKATNGDNVIVTPECPFCGKVSDDLRLYVNINTGAGICFHCGKGFSAISFIREKEGISASAAIKLLNGAEDGYVAHEEDEEEAAEENIWPVTKKIEENDVVVRYLSDRCVKTPAHDFFRLAACDSDIEINDKVFYLKDRLFMPIFDIEGKPIAWQARDTSGRSRLRYIASPNFESNRHLFNSQAIPHGEEYLLLVEGIFDAIGWWQAGFKNVVASFGKKLSIYQADLLSYLAPKRLYVAWDSDAYEKKFDIVKQYKHRFADIKIIDLEGRDADEMESKDLADHFRSAKSYCWEDEILCSLGKL
jgi:DNA primase